MNNRRISLRSLFFYLLRRFWIILLCAAVGGALLTLYHQRTVKAAKKETELTVETISLTEDEKKDVENAAMQYTNMTKAERYYNHSPLMTYSAKMEKQVLYEYMIRYDDPKGQVSYGTIENMYLQLLRAYINDGVYADELIKKDSSYDEFYYIKELVWCNNNNGGEFSLGVIEYDPYPTLAEDVRAVTEEYIKTLTAKEKGLTIELVKTAELEVYDSSTESAQRAAITNLITYRKAYYSAYKTFTAQQKVYFHDLIGQPQETEEVKSGFSLTYLAIGVIIGGALGIGVIFLMLYLSGKLASPSDYAENVGLRSFGMLSVKDAKKGAVGSGLLKAELKNKLLDTEAENLSVTAVRIETYCKNHGITRLALLSSKNDAVVEEAAKVLKKELSQCKIQAELTVDAARNGDALRNLLGIKKGILIEHIQAGNRQKLGELLQFCKENEVDVIGSVGVAGLSGRE